MLFVGTELIFNKRCKGVLMMKKVWKNGFVAFALAACFLGMPQGSMNAKAELNDYREESLKDIKNVIIMIGDGMGPNQVKAGEIYKGEPLHMQTISQTTYSLTASANNDITDSAAGGTALATGVPPRSSTVWRSLAL